MGFFNNVLEHVRRIVGMGVEAFEQLMGRHHYLVGSLAPTATSTHAIGHYAQDAAVDAHMAYQCKLVLLVVTVAFVQARRGGNSET